MKSEGDLFGRRHNINKKPPETVGPPEADVDQDFTKYQTWLGLVHDQFHLQGEDIVNGIITQVIKK